MKAFITGATGFIGGRVLARLLERGYEVRALVRSAAAAERMRELGVEPVRGDITDRESLRAGMQGCDLVFHVAGWYKIGGRPEQAEAINVEGTRNVLTIAHELGIPRIVYTSTIAIFGDTQGALVDESYHMAAGAPPLTEYDRTKYLAHYEVAGPLIRQGAPVIIVQPGAVYGPDDPSLVGQLMRMYHRGLLPVLPGPELTLTYAHVDDIAEGHILAAEKGRPGESYILSGPALNLHEISQVWAEVTGRRPPRFEIPARWIQPLEPLMSAISQVAPVPELLSADAIRILGATYIARANKAQDELGWVARDVREGMRETFESYGLSKLGFGIEPFARRQAAGLALAGAVLLLLTWFITRRRR